MHVSEPRRALPLAASALLISAAVAVLSVPAAQSTVQSTAPAAPARPAARMVPADLYRSQQWTLGALHIPRAWKYSRGNGVTVAVLDTGVDGHQPDLAGRVIDGPDFTGHTRKPGDRYWGRHGTSMASIIAGHGHGPGGTAGVMGVAPDAKILSIRVTWELTDPARSDHTQVDHSRDAIAEGIRYAADHGAQVISMSLGGGKQFYDGNALEEAAIKYALGKGLVLVASAGNDGGGANRRNYPAAYPGVIAVGAVDRAFRPAKFTNRHTYVSVAAPGVEIVSADVAGHGYILGTGTSSSAAFVAGMSALVKARYPNLTPPEVKQALEEGATHRPPDGRSTKIGTGVADALGALRAAAQINKAEHGGAAVNRPGPTGPPAAPASAHCPDLVFIAVLSGGGTLMLLSLILGWRQRRRRPGEDDDEDIPAPPTPTRSAPARAFARSSEVSPWEPRPAGTPSPLLPSAEASSWEPRTAETPQHPAETSPWEPHTTETPQPSAEVSPWEPRMTETPPPPAETSPWGQPAAADPPFADDAKPYIGSRRLPEPLEPYQPPASAHTDGNGGGNGSTGHLPPATQDFRVAGGLDPLSDGPIDSSADVGTPLADLSWDSIRRGFDRLKEDASTWESLSKDDVSETNRITAQNASDETVNLPVVQPDDKDET
ncbi:MAG: peptidase and in kexin sedolisin [Actinoallomurus sp.]|nr:peptidase and in kexin sedolisin [Actinoallomurus sp.]